MNADVEFAVAAFSQAIRRKALTMKSSANNDADNEKITCQGHSSPSAPDTLARGRDYLDPDQASAVIIAF
jgi:hypothetical protein